MIVSVKYFTKKKQNIFLIKMFHKHKRKHKEQGINNSYKVTLMYSEWKCQVINYIKNNISISSESYTTELNKLCINGGLAVL